MIELIFYCVPQGMKNILVVQYLKPEGRTFNGCWNSYVDNGANDWMHFLAIHHKTCVLFLVASQNISTV
jgi:hypothetical protein